MREMAHAQKRNPLSDLDEILHDGRYPRRNHVGKFGDDRFRGLGVAGGQIFAFLIDIDRRPYNTLALPCECVICVIDVGLHYFCSISIVGCHFHTC